MDPLKTAVLDGRAESRLFSVVRRLALGFSIAVAIGLPITYFYRSYEHLTQQVDTLARVKAAAIDTVTNGAPELWRYNIVRMEEVLLRGPFLLTDERVTVRDIAGSSLFTIGKLPEPPVLTLSAPVHDFGQVVGSVEIVHSYRDLIFQTLTMAFIGALLGAMSYIVFVMQTRQYRLASAALAKEQASLRESEQHYRTLFDSASDGIMTVTESGRIVAVNRAFARMHGYRIAEILTINLNDLDTPKTQPLIKERMQRSFSGEAMTFEAEHYHKDGHTISLEVTTNLISTIDGPLIQALHRNITERKRIEAALQESEQKFRLIAENTSDGITIFDKDRHVQYVSPSVCKQLGYSEQEELGRSGADVYSLVHPEERDALFQELNEAIQTKKARLTYSYRFKHKSGHYIWREDSTNFRYTDSGEYDGAYVVSRDISLRKRMEEELHQLACFDPLTQLPNRHMLRDRISQTMSASKRSGNYGALMALDLDNFKPLNDAHGHHAGDLLLAEVAKRLTECVRETDTVARVGGDEFVVILGELNADPKESARQAGEVAEKIRINLAAPYRLVLNEGGMAGCAVEHRCSASIGVVLFLNHEASQADLLKWADSAMYQAKRAGRNAIRFYGLTQQTQQ